MLLENETVVLKLPPLPPKKSEMSLKKVRMQKKAYLKRFPEEHLGPKGEVFFLTLLKIMRNKSPNDNYYLKHKIPKNRPGFSPFDFRYINLSMLRQLHFHLSEYKLRI